MLALRHLERHVKCLRETGVPIPHIQRVAEVTFTADEKPRHD